MRTNLIPVVIMVLFFVACGEDRDRDYIDETAIEGGQPVSWSFPGDGSMRDMVRSADSIGIFAIESVESIDVLRQGLRGRLLYTTYRATPVEWIRGEEPNPVLVTQYGGIDEESGFSHFSDGSFLLQEGQTYALMMRKKRLSVPGPGTHELFGGGRGAFQVTDGLVHVLNHQITAELSAEFNGMPLPDFAEKVREFASLPRLVEEPSSYQTGEETDTTGTDPGAPGVSSILPSIEYVGIDADITANSASVVGTRESCASVDSNALSGGTVDLATSDTLVDADAAFDQSWLGASVELITGTGVGQMRQIVGVSPTHLTISPPWDTLPGSAPEYVVRQAAAVDVVASGIPPFAADSYHYGLQSVGLVFEFDPAVVAVLAVNPNGDSDTILAASGPRIAFDVIDSDLLYGDNNDPLPSTSGLMRVDLSDLSENFDSGSGVLARLLLTPRQQGSSQLLVTPELNDASGLRYDVGAIYSATINVDLPCPD